MNPASSRATAVQVTVIFLPRAENARKRALSRDCAFQAISRILRRYPIEFLKLLGADARREPVGPRTLDQQLANARVAHLGLVTAKLCVLAI
jgi:hypothetical protein